MLLISPTDNLNKSYRRESDVLLLLLLVQFANFNRFPYCFMYCSIFLYIAHSVHHILFSLMSLCLTLLLMCKRYHESLRSKIMHCYICMECFAFLVNARFRIYMLDVFILSLFQKCSCMPCAMASEVVPNLIVIGACVAMELSEIYHQHRRSQL